MRNLLLLLTLSLPVALSAQTPAPPLFRPDSARLKGQADIRERLVNLALQNPNYEIADHTARAAYYNIKLARVAYLNMFVAAGNINEFTFNTPKVNGQSIPFYYPKYNFGVSIPFGIFSQVTNQTRAAREMYAGALATKNAKALEIKADVLTKYENYLLAKQLVDLQTRMTQAEYSTYKRAESDFQENLIKLEQVETAQRNYVQEQVKGLNLQRDLNLAKIALEMIIGVRIEDVERGMR
jgi:outer membrane protein TolC